MLLPGLILIIGALLLPSLPRQWRYGLVLLLPLVTLVMIWQVPAESAMLIHIAGFDLYPLTVHPFTRIFATVFALAAFGGGLFGVHHMQVAELSAALLYAGSAICVTFAGDWMTLFIFWEIMAIASTVLVLYGRTTSARKAALRYAVMHFFGGVVLLAGIAAYTTATGSNLLMPMALSWEDVKTITDAPLHVLGIVLILVGVLINAGAPPFSSWLPDAYPEASPGGAVFLSAFTTKTAVFVLLTLFAGAELLIWIGLFMVFYGIIWAMLENDMRRILSYSIVNQVGFMVTGVGIGTGLAQFGVATHAFTHIIYKGLLLMSAGSVLQMTGKRKCSELGGLYHTMKLTTACGIVGALAISAFPWTSGFVSKSMIASAAGYEHMEIVWFLLVAASAGVFLHAGIKFPWFVFFHNDSGMRPDDPPEEMRYAMLFFAALCILPGLFPEYLYLLLPGETGYVPYTPEHVVTQLQLLLFAGLAFFIMLPWLKRTLTITLDFDWFTRILGRNILLLLERLIATLGKLATRGAKTALKMTERFIVHWHGPDGALARNWALGNTVLITTGLLGMVLMLYYIGG